MAKNTLESVPAALRDRLLHDPRLTLADRAHLEYFSVHGISSDRVQALLDRLRDRYRPCRSHKFAPVGLAGHQEVSRCKTCGYISTADLAAIDRHLRRLEAERLEVQS